MVSPMLSIMRLKGCRSAHVLRFVEFAQGVGQLRGECILMARATDLTCEVGSAMGKVEVAMACRYIGGWEGRRPGDALDVG
jgi:hypothetical protein